MTRWTRTVFVGAGLTLAGSIVLSLGGGGAASWAQGDSNFSTKVAPAGGGQTAQVARGRYIATAADCVACHTAPDGKPFAGGYTLDTPFGKLLSSNITSDRTAGIGGWTEQQFDAALRKGMGRNGHLYPAMPYTSYTKMTDADVVDLWAYMRTVAPVASKVEENQLPFPFSFRPILIGWNLLFFSEGRFRPDAKASVVYNRGAYLSEALEHCGMCHTPKTLFGSDKRSHAYEGATLQGWNAPDLTNNTHTGLGRWSTADLVTYLKSGSNRFSAASGPMGEAVVNSTQHLKDADLYALSAYFKAQPARAVSVPGAIAVSDPQIANGRQVFAVNCAACHVSSGKGVRSMIPALAGNPSIAASDPASLVHVVLKGTQGTETETNPTGAGMPRFDWKLSDTQIADALTYIRNAWGNAAPAVTAKQVAKARKTTTAQAALVAQ